jgi:hypothetical protein
VAGQPQEAKYVESWPCYSAPAEHWGLLPVTSIASRIILIEQNIKSGQGQHSVYSVFNPIVSPTTRMGGGVEEVTTVWDPSEKVNKRHFDGS